MFAGSNGLDPTAFPSLAADGERPRRDRRAASSTPRTASPGRSPPAAPSRSCSPCSPPGRAPDTRARAWSCPRLGARGVPQGRRLPRRARGARRRRPRARCAPTPPRWPRRSTTRPSSSSPRPRPTPTAWSTPCPRSRRWPPSAASAATSTPASAAGCCRTSTARRRGPSRSRASRASASTCTSTPTRPRASRCCSTASPALRRTHLFASANWPGYTMLNSTMQSTRSGGPLAAAWAVTHRIGVEGYARLAREAREATLAVADGGRRHPGPARRWRRPDSTLVALAADDSCDVFTDRRRDARARVVRPAADVLPRRAADPAPHPVGRHRPVGARARRGAAGVGRGRPRRRPGRHRPGSRRRSSRASTPRPSTTRASPGCSPRPGSPAATAPSPCPRRMAPVNALLDACPPALREALLLGVLDRLSRPTARPEQPPSACPSPRRRIGWGGSSTAAGRTPMAPETPDPALSHTVGRDTPPLLEQTIGDNLDATVARVPDRDALVDRASGIRLTYAELGAEVDRLARGAGRAPASARATGSASGRRTAPSGCSRSTRRPRSARSSSTSTRPTARTS